jgi:hypothetical protein
VAQLGFLHLRATGTPSGFQPGWFPWRQWAGCVGPNLREDPRPQPKDKGPERPRACWGGAPHHVSLRTVTFTEHGSKTMLSHNTVFQTVEDRDRELESGMGEEADDSMERQDELLARFTSVR